MDNYLPPISSFDSVCATLSGDAYLSIDNEYEDFSPLALTLAKYSQIFNDGCPPQVNHVCDLFRSKDTGKYFPSVAATGHIGNWIA